RREPELRHVPHRQHRHADLLWDERDDRSDDRSLARALHTPDVQVLRTAGHEPAPALCVRARSMAPIQSRGDSVIICRYFNYTAGTECVAKWNRGCDAGKPD